jgi:exodeoxyribonuclease III
MAEAVLAHAPDVCVMAESRVGRHQEFAELLRPHGYVHVCATDTMPRKNGVLVASREPFAVLETPPGAIYEQRWLRVRLDAYDVTLLACHVPPKISIGVDAKRAFWATLLDHAAGHIGDEEMIIGDLNTGAPYRDEHRATLYCGEQFERLGQLGLVDAWRRFNGPTKKEWSWVYPNRPTYGYRLDHAFCTPSLAERLEGCRYSHDERKAGVSDHSILLVDMRESPSSDLAKSAAPPKASS